MKSSQARLALAAAIFAAFVFSSVSLFGAIEEGDFFWHLKTGEWIWQHRSLPWEDPFSYTAQGLPDTANKRFLLTSYWGSQVLFHLFFLAGGMPGIIIMRFAIAGLLLYAVLKRSEGDRLFYLSLVLIFLTFLLRKNTIERPQLFSFIGFALLLGILDGLRKGKGTISFALPLLMLVWANMHGGYALGVVVIVLYLLCEGLKFVHPSLGPMDKGAYGRLLISGASGIAASVVNPNSLSAFSFIFGGDSGTLSNILEYQSSLILFLNRNDYAYVLYWLMLLFSIIALILNIRKPDITETLLLAGTGVYSFQHARFIPFFIISCLPVISRYFSGAERLRKLRLAIIVSATIIAALSAWDHKSFVRNVSAGTWVDNRVYLPIRAADFILASGLKGNMYNNINLGGYLIFRLAPERKVFIDPRNTSVRLFNMASLIDIAYGKEVSGLPFWKRSLESYGVTYVIIPIFDPAGNVYPLLYGLLDDDAWLPVFFSMNSTIFVKDTPENYEVMRKFAIPKEYFTDDLISVCDKLLKANPSNLTPHVAKGDLYMRKNMYEEAGRSYERFLLHAPLNRLVREKLKVAATKGRQPGATGLNGTPIAP